MWSSYGFRSPSSSNDTASRESAALRSSGRPVEITVRNLDAELQSSTSLSTTTSSSKPSAPVSMGWLLRLFQSEFFDAFMAVTYLYRYRESRGVHDYLCNELYKLSDADLETFMPQVCNLLVHHAKDSPALERFVMDKCAESMHMALQVFWFLQAAVEDAARAGNKESEAHVRLLRTRCETAAVNGSKHAMLAAATNRVTAAALVAVEAPFTNSKRQIEGKALFPSSSAGQLGAPEQSMATTARSEGSDDIETSSDHSGGIEESIVERTTMNSEKHSGNDDVDEITASMREVAAAFEDSDVGSPKATANMNADKNGERNERIEPQSMPAHENNKRLPQERNTDKNNAIDPERDFDPVTLLAMKQERFDYFNDSISIARAFVGLSLTTRDQPHEQRQAHLAKGLEQINDILLRRMKGEPGIPLVPDSPAPCPEEVAQLGRQGALRSVHLPLARASSAALRILRVNSEEAVILTSRTRAPYLVNIEVLPSDMLCSDKLVFCEQRVIDGKGSEEIINSASKPPRPRRMSDSKDRSVKTSTSSAETSAEHESAKNSSTPSSEDEVMFSTRRLSEMTPAERQRANVRKIVYGDAYSRQPETFRRSEEEAKLESDCDSAEKKVRQAVILGIYGELWSWKEERILSKSPFRDLEGTRLMPFIVKAGDDLRQEQLAVQLISQFKSIFEEERVDVFLRPFTVMSVSSEAGFVEVITDAVSVHSLKKRTPNFVSLLDYFERAFGPNGSISFAAAQRRFIRSMAGYSLVTYFLQIKDRHNGNIMIDAQGRIIHIDFGFMLTNSPGAIKFENVPFKLTEEYLQVICAKKNVQDLTEASKTDGYRYFQELFVLGLLAARKHYEKITTLVEIMTEGTTMPCMTGGHSIIETLRSRFAVGMPEEQCINFAIGLIEESRLSWRSAGYDRFQAYSNGYR